VDIKAAQEQGQLTVVDADELLPRFMGEEMPDAPYSWAWLAKW
jgi:hypothetical protein